MPRLRRIVPSFTSAARCMFLAVALDQGASSMSDIDSIIDHIVVGGASRAVGGYDDWVDVCGVVSVVQQSGVSGDELLGTTLVVIREILSAGLMEVGVLSPDMTSFVPWRLEMPDALARIEHEWRELGREPNLWEV